MLVKLKSENLGGLEVAGCRISVGARALAKHVPRSLDGWWGSITGTGISLRLSWEDTVDTIHVHDVSYIIFVVCGPVLYGRKLVC